MSQTSILDRIENLGKRSFLCHTQRFRLLSTSECPPMINQIRFLSKRRRFDNTQRITGLKSSLHTRTLVGADLRSSAENRCLTSLYMLCCDRISGHADLVSPLDDLHSPFVNSEIAAPGLRTARIDPRKSEKQKSEDKNLKCTERPAGMKPSVLFVSIFALDWRRETRCPPLLRETTQVRPTISQTYRSLHSPSEHVLSCTWGASAVCRHTR